MVTICTIWFNIKNYFEFDVHVTVHHYKFLIIKPARCINFSNLFLEWNSACCGQFLCPSSGVFHCTHSNGICHTGLLTACEQYQDGTAVPPWSLHRTRFGRDYGPVVRQTAEWCRLCVNAILTRTTSGHSVGTFKQSGALANVVEHRTEKYFRIVFLASGPNSV